PLYASTTFARDPDGELVGDYVYGRYANPTVRHAESLLARLEGGADARLFASGLAATGAVLATVAPGRRVVAPRVMYHGAQDLMRRSAERGAVELTLVDATDPGALARAVDSDTDLVWIETPVNPTWDVIDVAEAAAVAHAVGATLAVDLTVAPLTTPAFELGADLVMHSATKYLNGHADVIAGALVTARDDDRWTDIDRVRTLGGAVSSPFDAWLLVRGLRTLPLRVDRSAATAARVARFLADHPAVLEVRYPGLPDDPGHEVARRQMRRGFGAMVSFRVRGGADAARAVVAACRVWMRATSLGGVESLVEHRATVEGPHSVVPDDLIRLSVGIEDPDDLIGDLDRALARAGRAG
ncbi:MAG: cystathionine gamma-synthase, partial [Actinomyces sp.]